MLPSSAIPTASSGRFPARVIGVLFAVAGMGSINAGLWLLLHSVGVIPPANVSLYAATSMDSGIVQLMLAGLAGNLVAIGLFTLLRRRVVQPWRHIRQIVRHASQTISDEREAVTIGALDVREMAGSIARFAALAQNAYARCRALQSELDESRQMLAQIVTQHQVAVMSTNRELVEQYRSVLAYANYLDEHIRSHQSDAQLRYDFDDVCESGFNLKLIAQSLELLRATQHAIGDVPLSGLLQQTVIALAPSLERRSMRLSTAGIDAEVVAKTDTQLLSHALWMMLLGTIRYAAAESTLRLRCFISSNGSAIISIGISELEPGQLSPEERQAHMVRQLQHMTHHMFAETIRLHANAQLAGLMLARAGGSLSVLPINTHACEISLVLPGVKK